MATVIGLRFRRAGKLYYFGPGSHDFKVDDYAIVSNGKHLQVGRVVLSPTELAQEELKDDLKLVERKASVDDLVQMQHFQSQAEDALATFRELILDRNLPISPVQADYSFDGANLTFQFSAQEQIDFQSLARELAEILETRVELRQIGARDRASVADGVGRCGLSLCCSTWLVDPGNVTIRMAKDQNLPLNPSKISGVCGRLLCCLRYEHEMYLEGPLTVEGDAEEQKDDLEKLFERATSGRNRYVADDEVAKDFLASGLETDFKPSRPIDTKTEDTPRPRRKRKRRSRGRRRRD